VARGLAVISAILGDTTEAKTGHMRRVIEARLGFRLAVLSSACLLVLGVAPGFAVARHTELAPEAFLHAVRLQQKLLAKPASQRTAADYERVIREYRDVYLYDFAYAKAPIASQAMGDLYVQMGRRFRDSNYFNSAIKSYQYTASQYPGTSMARESAFAVGNVYLDGLDDPEQAADAYRAFLEEYPGSSNADEAKEKLKEIADAQAARERQKSASDDSGGSPVKTEASDPTGHDASGSPAEVTDIHSWVGPNYTRVVIEARGQFQYTTLRLSNPDRIVFDLPNTHLSHAMMKKSLPLDGAFLRGIRVGQFKPDVTRVVLDVKNISKFSAFPVPNPFRLIIDVHGSAAEMAENGPGPGKSVSAATKPGRVTKARAEQKTTEPKEAALAPSSRREANADSQAELQTPAKRRTTIEFDNQQAVMDNALAGSEAGAKAGAKPKIKLVSDRQPLAAKPTAEAASMVEPGRNGSKAAGSKNDAPSPEHASPKAKDDVETASDGGAHGGVPLPARPASPTRSGSQTLTRALGLKVARIVIDPGHGGHDTGTIGPSGLEEKDLVLDVGLRLRKLIETETDSEVFMTRSTDKFIPLEERTAIANEDGADLFISIHANASSDQRVRGIETYYLNFTRDPEALQLAARENATSQESVHQLQDLIQKIALNNKIEESQELARNIQTVLYKRMSKVSRGIHNRGVRQAPFVVLIGANMPSILTEISFLSNAHSERLLKSSAYREQIAKALFNGVEVYINNLGSVRMAQSTR
jgi:N-acetylmuramoyl-L-alanine amidase